MDNNKTGISDNAEYENTRSNVQPLAIEGPPAQNNSNQAAIELVPNQPRQPTNLQGLLRFAMEATKAEDAPHAFQSQPMDEEKKKFLEEALAAMSVNITEELQKDVKLLQNVVDLHRDDDSTEYEAALDRISDYIDNLDIANDFYKIGGFSIFGSCLNSCHAGIRWRVANLIAELTQNNPYCQERILEAGFLPVLLDMIDTDTSELARIKALYAVSCITRGHPETLKHMEKHDGYSVLIRAIQSPVEKLQIKSAFLLSALCNKDNDNHVKVTVVKMGLIEQIAGLLTIPNLLPEAKEQLLSVLNSILSNNYEPALEECRRPELCLKVTLEKMLKESETEENTDRVDICEELLEKIFACDETEQDR